MLNIVIFGAPGSGKGTQSDRLISKYGLHHISTGEVLRDHIARGTELGKIADSYISKGQLIPDDLMIRVLEHVLDSDPENTSKGVIFDGFPRTIDQAKALKKMLASRGSKVHAVVGLEVPEDELIRRMINRGKETGRADDNLDTIKNRLSVYHSQTSPLREYYISEGKYHGIDGAGDVDEIFSRIKESLHSRVPGLDGDSSK
ncbi:MAG: adenylate kinase [Muribaculaceae bacterium]|nr:adenylate kinase [Muribaculaceae bacterium]